MKKMILAGSTMVFLLFGITGLSQAKLIQVGIAVQNNEFHYMIYDDVSQLTWLDYTSPLATWNEQKDWANSLNTDLQYYWAEGYDSTIWDESGRWRLPSAGNDPKNGSHMEQSELGNLSYGGGFSDISKLNTSPNGVYWTSEGSTQDIWAYSMHEGFISLLPVQTPQAKLFGIAVRSGQ